MKKITINSKEKIEMIRLYRFMSIDEISALMKGDTITRYSPHYGRTTAGPKDICFMTGDPVIYDYYSKSIETITPLNSSSSLDGVVDTQFLVEVTVPVSSISWGTGYYADFIMEEAYIESYSSKDVTKVWKNKSSTGYGFKTGVIEFIKSSRRKEDSTIHQIRERSKKKEEVVKPRVKMRVSTNN